jgi:uncharacterized SAM-binding protein YcdF (DUF218 family)
MRAHDAAVRPLTPRAPHVVFHRVPRLTFYVFKQLVGAVTTPLTVALILALVAVIFRAFSWRRTCTWLLLSAASVAYLASIDLIAAPFLGAFETRHAPLRDSAPLPDVRYVVVLGSDYHPRKDLPVTSALDSEGVLRLVEGVRLVRRLPNAQLVVSGGLLPGRGDRIAAGYARLARELGVPEVSIVILDQALDTAGEARDVAAKLGAERFLLVTSTSHMARAMMLMERVGARPVAAPTGHHYTPQRSLRLRMVIPNSDSLRKTETALHELLGFIAVRMGLQ